MHLVGPDGIILGANHAELEMLGYDGDEYVGRHIAEFHVDRAAIDDMLGRLARGETLRNHPARLRCKDGSIKAVVVDSNVKWDAGRFVHTRCFTRDVTELRTRAEASERRIEVLADLTRSVTMALDLDTVLHRIVEGAQSLCGSDTAAIFLRDAATGDMVPRSRVGPWLEAYKTLRIHGGEGVGGQVMLTGRPIRTGSYLDDGHVPPHFRGIARETGTIALMVVPITIAGRVEGLLYISNRVARPFTDEDEAMSVRLADQAAVALQNAGLFHSEQAARTEAEVFAAICARRTSSGSRCASLARRRWSIATSSGRAWRITAAFG